MILRDPVHGLVSFERPREQVVVRLMDTPELQRLRRVRALGVASLAFPGAEHSRFAHAVGAAFVMQRFLERVGPLAAGLDPAWALTDADAEDALAAALLHDVGHGPLSHLFEEVFPSMRAHEAWTSAVVLNPDGAVFKILAEADPTRPDRVNGLVHGKHRLPYLAKAVSGTFDVDRCDYLLRDSYMTGTRYGLYDLEWLLRSLRLEPAATGPRLAVDGSKGLPAVEGYFLARVFMYQQVYYHKATRAAEALLRGVFRRFADLVARGSTPVGTPPALSRFARGEGVSVGEYLSLDDNVFWCAVDAWRGDADPVLANLCERAMSRVLPKTASLDDVDPAHDDVILDALRDIVRRAGFDPDYHAALDVAEVAPYELARSWADALRVVYDHRPPRLLEDASFLIGRLQGGRYVRRRLVFPREVRDLVDALLLRHQSDPWAVSRR
ncbi:MAG: HD domain-containing protein [Polyangiales bacterium]